MHNVLFDNATPDLCAHQLLGCDADVLVIVESTQAFLSKMDALGGRASFPHRVTNDLSVVNEYAVRYARRCLRVQVCPLDLTRPVSYVFVF